MTRIRRDQLVRPDRATPIREAAREVLAQIDPMRSLADRLSALGLDDRAIWSKTARELAYALVWRFGATGHARLDWRDQRSTPTAPAARCSPSSSPAAAATPPPGPACSPPGHCWRNWPRPIPAAWPARSTTTRTRTTTASPCWKRRRQSRRRPPDKPVARLRAVV